MASLVSDFQKDLLNQKKSVTDILRTAKLISAKLALTDIEQWITSELNGYSEKEPVPEYREAYGMLQVRNPYHGWQIVTGGNTRATFRESIPQIEEFSHQKTVSAQPGTNFELSSGDEWSDSVSSSLPQRVVFVGTVFKGMVEAVRNRLLEWSIELEKRGITGENMSFDEREKQAAQSQIFNIQNFAGVLGNVSHSNINIYDYSSIHQELKQRNVPQAERNELENILDELKTSPPEKKSTLIERGKAWIVRNQQFLGAGASIVRQALGIPDVA